MSQALTPLRHDTRQIALLFPHIGKVDGILLCGGAHLSAILFHRSTRPRRQWMMSTSLHVAQSSSYPVVLHSAECAGLDSRTSSRGGTSPILPVQRRKIVSLNATKLCEPLIERQRCSTWDEPGRKLGIQ